jgi:dynein heavy chain, axonemal
MEQLVDQNLALFNLNADEDRWLRYVDYIDGIVKEALQRTLGCSLAYLADNMDPQNHLAPFFEARLELREPQLVFLPPLDDSEQGLPTIIQGLIDAILKMAQLVPRIAKTTEISFEVPFLKSIYRYSLIFVF